MYLEKGEGGLGNGVDMTMGWLWIIGDPANGIYVQLFMKMWEWTVAHLATESHKSQSGEQKTTENGGSWWNGYLVGERRIGYILESTLKIDGLI